MDDPIEYGVGHGWLPDAIVPFGDRILAGNDCRLQSVSVFHDFQEVTSLIFSQRVYGPVIDYEKVYLCETAEDLEVAAVSFGNLQFPEKPRCPVFHGGITFPARFVGKGFGDICLAYASRPADNHVLV